MKKKTFTIWEGSRYIGTINYDNHTKKFTLIVNGEFDTYTFNNYEHLKKLIKRRSCFNISIPKDIIDEIDSIAIMNTL